MKDKNKTIKMLLGVDNSEEETLTLALNLVDHPDHYNQGKYETIDVIEDWDLDFNCGNAVKYISRHMHKGTAIRDIEKAIWYLKRRLDTLKKGVEND
tara:strand:- start:4358 stop:4648 length:291 start_codon:yes stop_codon:yes gene_type:complete